MNNAHDFFSFIPPSFGAQYEFWYIHSITSVERPFDFPTVFIILVTSRFGTERFARDFCYSVGYFTLVEIFSGPEMRNTAEHTRINL